MADRPPGNAAETPRITLPASPPRAGFQSADPNKFGSGRVPTGQSSATKLLGAASLACQNSILCVSIEQVAYFIAVLFNAGGFLRGIHAPGLLGTSLGLALFARLGG